MNVLFVNSIEAACGVHQFGLNLIRVLREGERRKEEGGKFNYFYFEPALDAELDEAIDLSGADLVLYNFYPCTMPWVSLRTLNMVRARGLKQVTIFHEVPVTGFDAYIYPDPTFIAESKQLTEWFPMGRPLPKARENEGLKIQRASSPRGIRPLAEKKEVPVIGSSGFGFGWKGHVRLVHRVLMEFWKAKIRLHLPLAKYGDADGAGARWIAQQCQDLVHDNGNPGITLEIDHEFMPPESFVAWLAGNDLNAYLYDDTPRSRGIASTIDHALAARRPIALTRSWMFRHLFECKGIFVSAGEDGSTLPEIIGRGTEPLRPIYEKFSDENVRKGVEEALRRIADPPPFAQNRLLTNADRERLAPLIEEIRAAVPEMMARKIPEANVQQAWVLEKVRETKATRIFCVGCFEDTTLATLQSPPSWRARSLLVTGIDPAIDFDLAGYRQQFPAQQWDCVFATSVLEHVPDDEQFIRDLCDLLNQDGVALLTVDYKANYQRGDPLPATVERFYRPADVERLSRILDEKQCYWVDVPDLSGEPDFVYQGHHYSFLALVFKKL